MAEEAAIGRNDVVSSAGAKAPLELIGNLKKFEAEVDKSIKKGKEHQKVIGDTKSTKQLSIVTAELIKDQKDLVKVHQAVTKELAKGTKEVEDNNKALNKNTVETNKAVKETKEYKDEMSKLKDQLKQAKSEMLELAETLGEDSDEYKEAAERAGELADAMGDVNDNIKASAGDTSLEQMTTRFGMLGDKIKNLDFKGASTQIDHISKLSKKMTFKEATQGLGQFTKGMIRLGVVILTNPLFLLAAIIVGVGVALVKLKDHIPGLNGVFNLMGDAIDWVTQKLKDFLDWIGLTNFALEDRVASIVEGAKKEIDAIEKRYNKEIKLAQSAGKQVFDLEKKKTEATLAQVNAAIKALNEKTAAQLELTEEEEEDLKNFINMQADLNNELKIIANEYTAYLKQEKEKRLAEERAFLAELIKMAEDAAAHRVQVFKNSSDQRIAQIQKEAIEQLRRTDLTEAQREEKVRFYENLIAETRKAYAIEALDEEIKAIEESLNIIKLDANEKEQVYQKLHDLRMALINEEYETIKNQETLALENTIKHLQTAQEFYGMYAEAIGNVFRTISENRLAALDKEEARMEENFAREIEMAGDNKERKKEIENELEKQREILEKKRLTEQRRAAVFDKAAALIQAGINTALAVTNQLSKGDPYTAFGRAIAAGVAGGIQILAIASKQIPQYEFGTGPNGTSQRLIIAGEAGREAYRTPSGRWGLTPARATLMDLPIGTQIFPHDSKETAEALAMNGVGQGYTGNMTNRDNELLYLFIRGQESLEKTIRNKKEINIRVNKDGKIVEYFLQNHYK